MKKYFKSFTNAIKYFIKKGYNLDFNLHIKAILQSKISVDAVYKFGKNNSDKEDNTIVYAITINNTHRGIYVDRQETDATNQQIVAKINAALKAA